MKSLLVIPLIFALTAGQIDTLSKLSGTWTGEAHGFDYPKSVFELSEGNILFSTTASPKKKWKLIVRKVEGNVVEVDDPGEKLMYFRKFVVLDCDNIKIQFENSDGTLHFVKFKKAEQAHRGNGHPADDRSS
jgi:hypothetical protein